MCVHACGGRFLREEITSLPVFSRLDEIAELFAEEGLVLLSAEPGAGKTTLVPWRLLRHPRFMEGKVLLLQPRRIAARAAAERIAFLLDEKPGGTVGLRTRYETITGPRTRVEVVTEGILARMLQHDQSLTGYATVIFDEFHERSLQADLGLALVWDCRETLRPDLRVLFMSATLPSGDIRSVFGDMPFLSVPGAAHPVEVRYCPPLERETMWAGAARLALEALKEPAPARGDVLVFLPGFREILRARDLLSSTLEGGGPRVEILHGRLSPEEQRRVLHPAEADAHRVILATNVAETSLTIPGIRAVVDCGYERRVRFSPRTGMDHWETVRTSAASAEQRRGRAGRIGPGLCFRWWNETEKLLPYSNPEIMEADLSPLLLETAAWGAGTPMDLKWLTPPPEAHLRRAHALLAELGLLDGTGRITPAGRRASAMGVHPRLARMIDLSRERGLVRTAALVAALLEEGEGMARDSADFRDRIDAWLRWSRGAKEMVAEGAARRVRDEYDRIMRQAGGDTGPRGMEKIDPVHAGVLLALAYPDRIAKRTRVSGRETRWVLAAGRGAVLTGHFTGDEFIVAPEMDGGDTDARIFTAAPIGREDIEDTLAPIRNERIALEWRGWEPLAWREVRLGSLPLERKKAPVPDRAVLEREAHARIMAEGIGCLPWDDEVRSFLARCRFVQRSGVAREWPDFSEGALLASVGEWLFPFGSWKGGEVFSREGVRQGLEYRLGHALRRRLDEWAPVSVTLPSGSGRRIDYESGDVPIIAARLQEFFGCAETPLIAGGPALLHLLSPAGRPVQITRDLGGFWVRSYREVRKELMGRYPRHYWPEDPMAAEPTNRAKPRKK